MGPAQTLAANVGLSEGPVFLRRGGLLTVPGDRGHICKLDGGVLSLFAVTGTGPNGLAEGLDDSVYVAMMIATDGSTSSGTRSCCSSRGRPISLVVLTFNLGGDLLRDILDPRLSQTKALH